MHDVGQASSIERWLAEVRLHFIDFAPELLPLFDTYAAEALFGRRFIDSDLGGLRAGAKVLEVGAGSLLLSCQLMREGFDITALEPTGDGFSHFDQMRQMVLVKASAHGCCPKIFNLPAERLVEVECFDFAFSVNVMEHVNDVARVLESVGNSLKVGASYRFTCPNYIFPYEPHFNIPTFFSKQLTGKLLRRKIFDSQRVPDPSGTWESLNWINVLKVGCCIRRLSGLSVTFNRAMLVSAFERVTSDPEFAARRSPSMRRFISCLVRFRIHSIIRFIPALLQPIIDCRMQKVSDGEIC